MPSWLSDWVGADMAPLAYYALVALIVLVLIVIVLSIARKVMGPGSGTRVKGRGPRLAVMDVSVIDPKRKLVLVRRDEVEHLLLIGGHNDLVVEAGILRVPASARQMRAEPSLQAEPDFAGAQRVQPAAARSPAGGQPAASRGASPLTRPVPRPAPVPAPERLAAPVVEPVATVDPVVQAPDAETAPAEPKGATAQAPRIEPIVEPDRVEQNVAPPVASPVEDATSGGVSNSSPPAENDRAVPIVVAPVVQPPVPAPVQRATTQVSPTVSSDDAAQVAAPSRVGGNVVPSRPTGPAPAVPAVSASSVENPAVSVSLAPARQPASPAPSVQRVLPREPVLGVSPAREPARPAAATPHASTPPTVTSPTVAPRSFAPPVQKTPASAETPFQRAPLPMTTAYQPRSMATPTLPVKPPAPSVETPAAVAATGPDKSDDAAKSEVAAKASEPQLASYDASAEPTPEAVLARLFAKASEASATTEPADVDPAASNDEMAASITGRTESAPPAVAMPNPAAPEGGERRPLSVRSFASAIQGRQASAEIAPAAPSASTTVARQPPRLTVPFAPAPVKTVESPSATFVEPMTGSAKPTPPLQPVTSWEDEEDDLENFLSAQLNDELGEEIWNAKDDAAEDAPAAPPEIDPPTRLETSTRAAEPAPATPVRRQLTLEEEMERLLGDFDLETADRRIR